MGINYMYVHSQFAYPFSLSSSSSSSSSSPSQVCRHCYDLLEHLARKPCLQVQETNPLLYTYVQDLATIEVNVWACENYT